MNKRELVERVERAKLYANAFESLQEQVDALLEYVLEQPKEPTVRARLPKG